MEQQTEFLLLVSYDKGHSWTLLKRYSNRMDVAVAKHKCEFSDCAIYCIKQQSK